jgi:hypothetical protein
METHTAKEEKVMVLRRIEHAIAKPLSDTTERKKEALEKEDSTNPRTLSKKDFEKREESL